MLGGLAFRWIWGTLTKFSQELSFLIVLKGTMAKTYALQGFSEAVKDCISNTAALKQLLERLSDAESHQLSCDIDELTVAVRAISNAVRGVASVAQLEATRNGL